MATKEGRVQKYAKERFEAIGGLVRKLSYENRRAAMDLLVVLPGGIIWFVEIKKDENTKPDPHQLREHERFRKRGANVFVVGSFKQVDTLIANYYSQPYTNNIRN
ncbi:TPA: VRR-NUC domain-containing protein [Escherichia coli]|nr:VRR-NUC domain-containing protein [Escherichia coli]